ncbi:leucyl-tRNA synthetase [Thermoflavifilum aggregans]|uniref:Leucine--tRNA ligase n=1 Tax=Thermoflavifilum aggregans TaxID=454188 RepID=A0A2M9CT84_9BACT|nr:class I tRNA ligase family protein [Thermoflavifilum aggregans]PJJ75124.1 leucyl-tRNA synthetase [Thermoflavifilum aggregans]
MEYAFRDIEKKWQAYWETHQTYRVENDTRRPKYYVLDMFPYPSGAGLHVGHPLGYIASDIYARFKRLQGFNVLHPMGWDAFGLPAEQYAIETGQHPAITTRKNIETFKRQLKQIGFCYDWNREINTSDPKYYRWTQWIFLQLFKSWFNRQTQKAEPIENLIAIFEREGNIHHECPGDPSVHFTADEWKQFSEKKKEDILMHYRLAYCGWGEVNWCEALGTVLANDEVVNGVSERGGYPVVKKRLRQWYLRITEYADRLLEGLQHIGFSEAMKEMQTNWIGKSYGANILFPVQGKDIQIEVFTTRPDTIFGVDFLVLAPEHPLVETLTTTGHQAEVQAYLEYTRSRNERERMAEKRITGCFTGSYALHPFSRKPLPIWVSEYVLAGYGTGAIMAVPCGDERDHRFAKHFQLPITNILGAAYDGEQANPTKDAILENSDFLNGMRMRDAIEVVIRKLEEEGLGKRKVNYKMRDAAFSRQRYWGEPFPIVWDNGIARPLPESALPLELPYVENYRPGPEGQGPLANLPEWTSRGLETNTMPGYAGSSWYFLRYMDPHNAQEFCSREASQYWGQVDVYVGGTEHAVGHLLYSRMWTKFLYDRGYIPFDEPYKKLINQGMIQGSSRFVYRLDTENHLSQPVFLSLSYYEKWQQGNLPAQALTQALRPALPNISIPESFKLSPLHVDIHLVNGVTLQIDSFRHWKPEYAKAILLCEDGLNVPESGAFQAQNYTCGSEVEKMSKSKYNTVNPDEVVEQYGADTFRMYEMFLGPIEQSKPWDTQGIEGVHRFLKKLWRLFFDEKGNWLIEDREPTAEELRVLHRTIKKVTEDTERFSFNTAVSQFMICVNTLTDLNCHVRAILEPLLILLCPYAPHISEELWHQLGHSDSVTAAPLPAYEEKFLVDTMLNYPIAINGKTRTQLQFPADASEDVIRQEVLQHPIVQKWIEGKAVKKVIVVKGRMINVVA